MSLSQNLLALSKTLGSTPASLFIQTQSWVIPTVQTTHILAIAVVLSSIGMVNLRILGRAGLRTSIADTADRYMPWLWSALVVLLLTGVVLVVGEPERDLNNWAFQLKMLLVVALVVVGAVFAASVHRRAPLWDDAPRLPASARLLALSTLALGLTIAVLGRWIAYAVNE